MTALECMGKHAQPERPIIGSGIMLVEIIPEYPDDDAPEDASPDPREQGAGDYFDGCPQLPSGERYMSYHLTCFEKVFNEFQRQEGVTIVTLAVAPVSFLESFFEEDEEDVG